MKLSVDIQAHTPPALRQIFWPRVDLRNVALLLAGFATVLVLVPPTRNFPTDDDWVYARSVQDILSGHYKLPGATATALGHTAWGALVSWLFGFNFTTLSLVSVAAAASCVVLLYVLLRQLGVTPGYSLLGTALLGCNPIFVYLSYSFMTDITFLAYMLAACVCFLRAYREHSLKWLLLASIVTSLAYMTRQFGILLVPVALIYLWWSREWRWRDAFAVSVLPVATALVYFLWEHSQPVPIAVYFAASKRAIAMSDLTAYAIERSQAFAIILATLGLSLAPLVRFPKHPILSLPVLACIVAFQVRSTYLAGSPFPVSGNIIDNTGFMSCCNSSPLWSLSIWLIIGMVGAAIISLYLVDLAEQLVQWLHTLPWRTRIADPLFFVYLLGGLLAVGTVAVGINAPFVYDRYFLPFLPMMMLPMLMRMSYVAAPQASVISRVRWFALLPLALFAVLGQHDYLSRAAVRWQAAENLVSQGIPLHEIYAGFEWQGWQLYSEGEKAIRARGDYAHVPFPPDVVLDPKYAVMQLTGDEYTEIGSLPYQSWLEGGATRYMLVLKGK